ARGGGVRSRGVSPRRRARDARARQPLPGPGGPPVKDGGPRFLRGWEEGFPKGSARLLGAAGKGYSGLLGAREWLYARGVLKSRALPVPVVSVGNLTVGGTGKTPAVEVAVQTLTDLGYRPAVVSRGRGRRERRQRVGTGRSGPDRRVRARRVLGGEPDAAREPRPAQGLAGARVRRDRDAAGVRGDARRGGRRGPAVPRVRRPPLVHARRDRDARRAGRRPPGRGPDDDRERLGAPEKAAPAAPAPLRLVDPPRSHHGRGPLAGRLRARVPESVIVRLPNWLGDTVMAV